MSVKITGVEPGSIGEQMGIRPGEILYSINGNSITDVLDYRFYETESLLALDVSGRTLQVKKSRYGSLGLEFGSYLMDRERSCKNKCVFCFIDQLPRGMRESLYFKDDDDRLSFLFGNYITLTNINEEEIDRIIKLRISPINVSVHTMNPELRCKMMNNRFAGDSLRFLKKLADGGIHLNCQLVLCPGLNDGDELKRSLTELCALGECLQSVACVPVGLSAHREGLFPLTPYTAAGAAEVIRIIEGFGDKLIGARGARTVFPSDEFYILAKKELPPYEFYEDFPQIENGVGMFRNLEEELLFALEEAPEKVQSRHVSLVTGVAIHPLLQKLLDEVRGKWDNIKIELIPVKNRFFGGSVDVTGLLTGSDILYELQKLELYEELLIPDVCLKAGEDIFLDDMRLTELETALAVPLVKVGPTGDQLLRAILGAE